MKLAFLKPSKKFVVIAALAMMVLLGIAGTNAPINKNDFKNLKVLPQDISREKLDAIMDQFNQSLGVKCNYCHAEKRGGQHMDFASDSNHTKDDARNMIRMTMQINKDFLLVQQPQIGDSTLAVSCYTCHHGSPYPDSKLPDMPGHNRTMAPKDSLLNQKSTPH